MKNKKGLNKQNKIILKIKELLKIKKYRIIAIVVLVLLIIGIVAGLLIKYNVFSKKEVKINSIEKTTKGNYINNDEKFIISTQKMKLDTLKEHIYIEPAVNYDIKQIKKNQYEINTKDIPSDTIVNIDYIDNDVVEDKWAFQSTKDFRVTSVYPSNNTSNNSVNTSIEIVLSYPDVDDINDSVEITPPVEGRFERNGRVWILKPSKPLEQDTTYTITIKDTLMRGKEKLKESMKSTFSTYATVKQDDSTQNINYDSITLDNIETFKPTENPMFRTTKNITRVELLKVNSSGDFKEFLNNNPDYKTTLIGDVDFEKIKDNLYKINRKLEEGYYLINAYLDTGELSFTIPTQINNLSAYLLSTQNDFLVWVASNNSLLKDIEVKYADKAEKTNDDGIATITDYNDISKKLKYVEVGKDNPLYIGLDNIDSEQLPRAYIYTDRPLYKNTDTIKIFGYIPLKYYEDKDIKLNDFVLSISDENIPVKIEKDGTFTEEYKLDNIKNDYKTIKLKYKNHEVATREVEVKQYEKEMYDFSIDYDKNYVKAGEKFSFKVGVKHISGVMVPNKEITAEYDGKIYTATTDEKGIATFTIDTKFNEEITNSIDSKNIKVKSTLTESSQNGFDFYLYTINRYIRIENLDYSIKNKTISANIYNLSDQKNTKKIISAWSNELKDTAYDGQVEIELEENERIRTIKGHNYNEITKENLPIYDYTNNTNTVSTDSINIKDGKLEYKINYDYKDSTDDISYSYDVKYKLKDKNGIPYEQRQHINTQDYSYNINGKYTYTNNHVNSINYDLYNYYMPPEEKKYSVNELLNRELFHYNGSKESENNKFLLIKYRNKIIEQNVIDNTNNIKTTFEDKNRPGVNITGAYLKDGNFYRTPTEYLDYNEENSKLNIDINTNKKTYSPQEEVETEILVTKNNKGQKVKLNISVVDEGVFKSSEDKTYIIETIYSNLLYNQYTYSTYRDFNLSIDGGGAGGTTGGVRSDFGDTIYFKTIETDSSGKAKIKFKLNDSITSFRITVHAVDEDVNLGVAHTNIESSIPVSISYTEPRGIKESDDLIVNATGIGKTTESIKYNFSIKELNKNIEQEGIIGKPVYANFGKLKSGEYTVEVTAKAGNAEDKVSYKVQVAKTQTEIAIKNTESIKNVKEIKPTKNPIKLEFYRASFKDYEYLLNILKKTKEERLDTKFTYTRALEYDNKYSGEETVGDIGDISAFKLDNGWKYLPGEEISYELTALLSYYDELFKVNKDIFYQGLNSDDVNIRINNYLALAALKEPILDDLKSIPTSNLSNESINKITLAYLLLGDYKKVREEYDRVSDQGLKAYISTYIDKENAFNNIKSVYENDKANRYVYFSIISFFENNSVDLSSNAKITVVTKEKTKKLEIPPLGKKSISIYQKQLNTLKFESKDDDIYVNYYYEGNIDEIDKENREDNIKISIDNDKPKLGDYITLNIDLTNIPNCSYIPLYLPNGLRFSSMDNYNFSHIIENKIEYLTIYVGEKQQNNINLTLYAASPGEYLIEPIVINKEDKYQLSNSIQVNISE